MKKTIIILLLLIITIKSYANSLTDESENDNLKKTISYFRKSNNLRKIGYGLTFPTGFFTLLSLLSFERLYYDNRKYNEASNNLYNFKNNTDVSSLSSLDRDQFEYELKILENNIEAEKRLVNTFISTSSVSATLALSLAVSSIVLFSLSEFYEKKGMKCFNDLQIDTQNEMSSNLQPISINKKFLNSAVIFMINGSFFLLSGLVSLSTYKIVNYFYSNDPGFDIGENEFIFASSFLISVGGVCDIISIVFFVLSKYYKKSSIMRDVSSIPFFEINNNHINVGVIIKLSDMRTL